MTLSREIKPFSGLLGRIVAKVGYFPAEIVSESQRCLYGVFSAVPSEKRRRNEISPISHREISRISERISGRKAKSPGSRHKLEIVRISVGLLSRNSHKNSCGRFCGLFRLGKVIYPISGFSGLRIDFPEIPKFSGFRGGYERKRTSFEILL